MTYFWSPEYYNSSIHQRNQQNIFFFFFSSEKTSLESLPQEMFLSYIFDNLPEHSSPPLIKKCGGFFP